VAEPLGLRVEEAADGILRIANAHMADLVRQATVRRGHDPRDFALYAFGGAAGQYAGAYAADLGCREVVIPDLAASFSAFGAIASDLRAFAEREVGPVPLDGPLDVLEPVFASLADQVGAELPGPAPAALTRRAGVRFQRQVHELRVEVTALDASTIEAAFRDAYQRIIGAGTAYAAAKAEVVSVSVEGRLALASFAERGLPGEGVAKPSHHRTAWFDGVAAAHPVYQRLELPAGCRVRGPAFIELDTTTVVVYPGQEAIVDTDIRLLVG
jgi:N-methylhydantoinase A